MTVPEGWRTHRLEEHSEIIVSPVDKKSHPEEQSVFLCNYMDVYSNERITSDINFMEATATSREIERFSLRNGDVLITKDSETPDDIARSAYVPTTLENVICGYHLAILRADETVLNGAFLAKYLESHSCRCYFSSMAGGATRFGLTVKSICETPILLPPLPEQKKIAAILSSVDETIQATRETIEQTKKLKQGLMQELLTRGIGHTRFKKTEIGEIPEEWQLVHLDELGKWQGGGTPSKNYAAYWKHGRIPWITSKDMKEQTISQTQDYITEEGLNNSSASMIPANSVLFVVRSGILRHTLPVAVNTVSASINQDLKALIPQAPEDALYIYQYCTWIQQHILRDCCKIGTTVESIDVPALRQYRIPWPTQQERSTILSILSTFDECVSHGETNLQKQHLLKKGLMQDLLTGKVRVAV